MFSYKERRWDDSPFADALCPGTVPQCSGGRALSPHVVPRSYSDQEPVFFAIFLAECQSFQCKIEIFAF